MPLRLATRSSRLAVWQANEVASKLLGKGIECEIVPVKSSGDIDLVSPIYEMGVQGVFTRELDMALLNNEADIAVHSLKDVPVVTAKGTIIAAILERASFHDVLIYKTVVPDAKKFVVATSSIRRRSQWLERYPHHETVNIRGNVDTRIEKLESQDFDGLIMAQAAIDRLNIPLEHSLVLDWMVPAPGQGAVCIVCREADEKVIGALKKINHEETVYAVNAERAFLHELKGGCSAPISALATISATGLNFIGAVHSLDGQKCKRVSATFGIADFSNAGRDCANKILESSEGRSILEEIFRSKPELGA